MHPNKNTLKSDITGVRKNNFQLYMIVSKLHMFAVSLSFVPLQRIRYYLFLRSVIHQLHTDVHFVFKNSNLFLILSILFHCPLGYNAIEMEVDGIHHFNNVDFKSFAIKGFLFLLQTNQFTQNEFPDSHGKIYTFFSIPSKATLLPNNYYNEDMK